MKKRNLYLMQLFDDPGTDPGNDPGTDPGKGNEGNDGNDGGSPQGKTYTDADLDRIIAKKFAKWQSEQQKKVSEAERLAKMTEAERYQEQLSGMQAELDSLKKEKTRAELSSQARAILKKSNITVDDSLVNWIVTDEAESTKTNVEAFAAAFTTAVKNAVAEALKGGQPKTGSSAGEMTKEEILKIADRKARQKAIAENIELFQ